MTDPINNVTHQDVLNFRHLGKHKLDAYQNAALNHAVYPGMGTFLGLNYVALKGAGECGEFAENVGKAMRDDGILAVELDAKDDLGYRQGRIVVAPLSEARREKLALELGDRLWYIAAAARELGYDLSIIAEKNLAKLASRSERGKLQGEGDDR